MTSRSRVDGLSRMVSSVGNKVASMSRVASLSRVVGSRVFSSMRVAYLNRVVGSRVAWEAAKVEARRAEAQW